ncbi:CocE/NonD family hydrolase [Phenylobacterium montanum]|uniref:CocE/NonD family hydrolase n=1 Tax=Phenylobacterium montanum TaxID=2823693 RepID=A0A975G3N3_9CAUL|nr:CocE/NonD family hydrolase [Caulobacter sp. S6]QUD90545.1 CocE/NonD family hydrolase [Caulobacter sp. S6]
MASSVRMAFVRRLAFASVAVLAGMAFGGAPAAAQQRSSQLAGQHAAAFFAHRVTGYLTTRDGVQLRYSVLLPKAKGRFPVIINYSGYDPGAIGGAAYLDGDTAMSAGLDRDLVQHGYAVMGVNARGTACSEGVFDFLGASYGQDGADIVEFAAGQDWSNGAVGMANWSWAGMSQIATASERPPHLKAIAPGMVLGDARLDSWAPGGVEAPGFVADWWDFLHSRWESARKSAEAEGDTRCLAQIKQNLVTSEPHSPSAIILQHPLRDAFIEQRHLAARTSRIQVPVLSMEAFQDEAVTSREGYYQETLPPSQVWMIQSNGPHDLYESLAFRPTLIAFFDRFVKGEPNGFDTRPHLQVWMETASAGTGEHGYFEQAKPRYVLSWPALPAPVTPTVFNLAASGRLERTAPATEAKSDYRYPVPAPSVDADFSKDQWGTISPDYRQGSLAFTSQPLTADLTAYGSASTDLWLVSQRTDTDVQVTLTELRPDGQEEFVQRSWLRASDRAVDQARATPVRAPLIDTPEALAPLTPGEPVLLRVELNKFAHVFRAGSRIRLWIDAPSDWGGYSFNAISMAGANTILTGPEHPSRLVLGRFSSAPHPGERPACGTVMKQPCRPDPLEATSERPERKTGGANIP